MLTFPSTPVLDSFNSGANQALSARAGWSAARIFNGNVDFTTDAVPTTAVSAVASDNTWGTSFTDAEVWAAVTAWTNAQVDLYLRWSGPSTKNGYSLLTYFSNFYIARIDAGVNTTISSVSSQTIAAGDSIGFRCNGSSFEGWYKPGAGAWSMLVSATDSTYAGPGAIGMDCYITAGSVTIDAFGGGPPLRELSLLGAG